VAQRVEVGDYESDFDSAVAKADLVFEAVTEDFEIKRQFFARVDKHRRPDSIVATVSSGLSINALAAGRSDSFRKNFLGLHFFNPPNVIVGTELIAGSETDPSLADFIELYAAKRLGRVMIRTFDTPGFAGNRIGFKVLNEVAQLAEEHGPAVVERLVGPYTGRAMMPLATIDLVGWDIHRAIVDNVYDKTKDEAHETLKLPGYMKAMVEKGTLGAKTGGGFFQAPAEKGKDTLVLDPKTGAYRPLKEVKLPDLGFIAPIAKLHRDGRYKEAMRAFVEAPGDYAALSRKVVAGYVSYAFHRVGEATETIAGIDDIMGFGFNWAPPSVLVDTIGAKAMVGMIEKAKLPVPKALSDASSTGTAKRFYTNPHGNIGRFFVAA
jgi:3-hydroxyacyl-CoA dehydrogenase